MPPTAHRKLLAWVHEVAALTAPDRVEWCDGSAERVRAALQAARRRRHLHPPVRRQAAQQLLGPLGPRRRGPRRGPDLRLLEERGRRRADQQLAGPRRDAGHPPRPVRGAMRGRTMYVVPFSMGPLGSPIAHIGVEITDSPYVAVSMRIMTRMGDERARRARRRRRLRSLPALGGGAARAGPGRRALGPATPSTNTSSTSPRPARSGPTGRVTAATPCWGRSASPCVSHRPWPTTRAGWPSTCSS